MLKSLDSKIVSEHSLNEIDIFLNQYYSDVFKLYKEQRISPDQYADLLLTIACGLDFFEDKEIGIEMGYHLCLGIKQEVERFPPETEELGMIAGFGNICFSVHKFVESAGILHSFSNSLNKLLLIQADKFLKQTPDRFGTNMNHYDMVFGMAGILNYLLEFEWDMEQKKTIEKIIIYLVDLSQDYNYQGEKLIRYHIPVGEQKREDEKRDFPNGHINFGAAHGMAGPLLALSKAYYSGYEVDGLKSAIQKLFHLYDSFQVFSDHTIRWPTQLSVEDYLNQKYNDIYRPNFAGWCYGNLGTASVLYTASKYNEDLEKINFYQRQLCKIINREVQEYQLYKIGICHGYAGMLFIRMAFFAETNEPDFINTLQMQIDWMLDQIKQYKSDDGVYDFGAMKELFEGEALFLTDLSGVVLAFLAVFGKTDSLKLVLGLK